MGRTELQDAVPMTVGQEFHAFAASLEDEIALLRDAEKSLYAVNMGATAIGTGINAPKGYAEKLRGASGEAHRQADRAGLGHARGDLGPAGLRRLFVGAQERGDQAVEDRERPDPAGLRPARRTGRDQPAGAAAGLVDHAGQGQSGHSRARQPRRLPRDGQRLRVTLAAHSGQLQLNAYEPLEGLAIMESQHLLYNTSQAVPHQVRRRHHGQREGAERYMETTVGIVTALNPVLGYEKATELATRPTRAARASSRSSARRRS